MAAEAGNATSQYNCAVAYLNSLGVPRDRKAAADWLLRAAKQGDREAQFMIADYAMSGGHAWAFAFDGTDYADVEDEFDRLWTHEEQQQMASMMFPAAQQGYPDAQCELGRIYETGWGRSKDIAKAREWYGKAANQGSKAATEALARLDRPQPA